MKTLHKRVGYAIGKLCPTTDEWIFLNVFIHKGILFSHKE
jgi:hypothetical protein